MANKFKESLTLVLIPGAHRQSRSLRIPYIRLKILIPLAIIILGCLIFLAFDYSQLLSKIYRDRHLVIENRQLREQIQIFQMKVNSLTEDLDRVKTLERKLRVISGLDLGQLQAPYFESKDSKGPDAEGGNPGQDDRSSSVYPASGSPSSVPYSDPYSDRQGVSTTSDSAIRTVSLKKKAKNLIDEIEGVLSSENTLKLTALYEKKILGELGFNRDIRLTGAFSRVYSRGRSHAKMFSEFDQVYAFLLREIEKIETKLHKLDIFLLDRQSILDSTPVMLPVNGWITSFYGPRVSPYSGRLRMHEGIDVGAPFGADIFSPADGVVVFSGVRPGFGKNVQIDHGYGIETLYAHSQKLYVKKGQKIKRGERLAAVGSTGHSTGPHLHYEVRINGVPVDPFYYILDR